MVAGTAVGAAAIEMAVGGLVIGTAVGDRVREFLPQACSVSPLVRASLHPIMGRLRAIITGPAIGVIMTVAAAIGDGRHRSAAMSATPSAGRMSVRMTG